ncbi:EamA family transporter [Lutispora saccharofermentans]|uniref:EamA family transporter n=1 Tax=Lutispora saccharofermentans TaxID=3024236 RepID=A0ABT1NGK6_9FIRM|nr:EamA family transporter [Lutispora saccharofermentans]MCQ1530395.1 EamA family transporter [Lutispora saccharofermentans]
MNKRDLTLALLVVTVWGANFTVIKLGLGGVPPMLLAAMRYTFTALPAIAFVKRPAVEWRYCIAYGLTVGVGQFSCLFYAMDIGMPAGISSIILQSQAFFTPLFAAIALKEPLKANQISGLAVAALGLVLIGSSAGTDGLTSIPLGALFLTVLAAVFWGLSNIIVRYAVNRAALKEEKLDMLSFVVWSSLVPPIPFIGLALMMDTPQTLMQAISSLNATSLFAVFYLVCFATLFGYGTWSGLLAKYPAGKVAPLSLMVPITGLITARIILGEQLTEMQWLGGLVIILGLVITNIGWPSIKQIFGNKDIP